MMIDSIPAPGPFIFYIFLPKGRFFLPYSGAFLHPSLLICGQSKLSPLQWLVTKHDQLGEPIGTPFLRQHTHIFPWYILFNKMLMFHILVYSRRFATATARTASYDVVLTPSRPLVTANDVGHWDQKHPKVLIVGKKNAKNLIAMYSGPTQFKK